MIKKITTLLLFVAISHFGLFSQQDTVLQRILSAESDSIMLVQLYKATTNMMRVDNQKAWYYADLYDSISIASSAKGLKKESSVLRGMLHFVTNEYDASIEYLTSAVGLYEKEGASNRELLDIYNTIAAIYLQRKDYSKSIEYYRQSLVLLEESNDSLMTAITLLNIAVPHIALKSYAEAEALLLKADMIFDKTGNTMYRGYSYLNLADNYLEQGRYDLAQEYAREAASFMPIERDPKIHSGAYLVEGKSNKAKGNYKKAIKDYSQGLEIAERIRFTNHMQEATLGLWQSYEALGQYKAGFNFLKQYEALKDTLNKEAEDKRMLDVLKKFEFEKKESEVSLLKEVASINEQKIRQQNIALGSAAVGIGLLCFLLYRIFDQKKGIEERNEIINTALKEKDILLREIHHRVKNNLQVISSLLGIQGRTIKDKKAKEAIQEGRNRVQSMALIHQNLYKKDNLTGIEMKPYIDKLATHLIHTYQVEDGTIEVQSQVDDLTLDVETVVPIGLIINELISNSLKYAFPNNGNGSINIELKEEEDRLLLIVSDNGIGLNEAQLQSKTETFGHSLIRAFKNKLKADIDISGSDGTKVTLRIGNYKKIG